MTRSRGRVSILNFSFVTSCVSLSYCLSSSSVLPSCLLFTNFTFSLVYLSTLEQGCHVHNRDYKLNDHHLPSSQGTSLPHYKFIYVITVASVFSLELLGGEISSCFTLHQCFPEMKILTIIKFNQHLLQKSTTEKRTGVSFRTWSRTVMNVGQMHQFNRIFMMLLDQDFTIEDLAKRDRHNNASPNCTRAWKTGLH